MRTLMLPSALPVSALLSVATFSSVVIAQHNGENMLKNIGQTFTKDCAACHVIPDPSFRTDRAWLDQINRTN